MASTLDGNKLRNIRVTGKGLNADLVDACVSAKLSTSISQVTEFSLTFQDTADLELFRSGALNSGSTVNYGGWNMISRVVSVGAGAAGPELTVKAPSVFVERLRGQVGGYSWGDRDVTRWAREMALAVGMQPTIQPGLGNRTIVRAQSDGDTKESSWDVMTAVARATGCWLFEYGERLIMARPSWLIKQGWGGRLWDFGWNNWADYSEGLAGMPSYSKDPNSNPAERLTVRILSPDADECRPGDIVGISGNVGDMFGQWLVTSVTYPLTVGDVVTATCQRPIDPVIPPAPAAVAAAGTAGAPGTPTPGGPIANRSTAAARDLDSFVGKYIGRAIDTDGAYGAQCVDLVDLFNTETVGGAKIWGNGNQWFSNGGANPSYMQIGAGSPAQAGDIACWGSFYGGGYGHVAVVIQDLGGSLSVFTQNPGPAHFDKLSKQGLQGYLRARKWVHAAGGTGGTQQWAPI